MSDLAVIILAAGKGTRMRSDLPKVFHEILGEPMLSYVLDTVSELKPRRTLLVVGHKRDLIMDYYKDRDLKFVIQKEQLGTGHAVVKAKPCLDDFSGTVLVLAGDVPLLSPKTLKELLQFHLDNKAAATDLTAVLEDAGNYGRIVRNSAGEIVKIVEKKDASLEELKIKEINTGTFCFEKDALFAALAEVRPENAQKEYYLTDTLEILRKKGLPVYAFRAQDPSETLGINTKEELVNVEKILLARQSKVQQADKLSALATMAAGMAHEIKNPLSSMKVLSQLLPIKINDPEYRKKLGEIFPREINRIDRIVESLLGFTRATVMSFELADIKDFLEDNLKYFADKAKEAEVKIVRDYQAVPLVEVDRGQISQVFSNLILNAIQAMCGGGQLTVSLKPGKTVEGIVRNIKVQVSDTGHGIAEATLKKLFDPFYTTKHGGTGLGLTISHSIVDGHKGYIDVVSQVGRGTSFTITLPVAQGLV